MVNLEESMEQILSKLDTPSRSGLDKYLPDMTDITITSDKGDTIEFSYRNGVVEGYIQKSKDITKKEINNILIFDSNAQIEYNKYPDIDCTIPNISGKHTLACINGDYMVLIRSDDAINIESPMQQIIQKIDAKPSQGTIPTSNVQVPVKPDTSSKGSGCLIATATYGTELAPQV